MNNSPFVQNVSRKDIELGIHATASAESTVLIQISDTPRKSPTPTSKFKHIYEFFFDDIEEESGLDGEVGITNAQAIEIANIIKMAHDNDYDIIVHCHAGLCRSGAVAQAAEAYGFAPGGRKQIPNLRVKHKVMSALGLSYDETEIAEFSQLRRLLEDL